MEKEFNWRKYLINNEDVARIRCTEEYANEHWNKFGRKEKRSFVNEIEFKWDVYVKNYKDLIENGVDNEEKALSHYIKFGRKEKRNCTTEEGENKKNNWKKILSERVDLMLKGVMNEESLKKIKIHSEKTININEECNTDVIFKIHKYLSLQTLMLRSQNQHFSINNKNKVAVIVEPRKHIMLEVIIRNIMYNLPDWDLHIFHSKINERYIKDIFDPSIHEYHTTCMDTNNLNAYTYSTLLKSKTFWDQIKYEHILIFQVDSFIFNNSHTRPESFFEYSYVGAPSYYGDFSDLTPNKRRFIGGFSLRRKSDMLSSILSVTDEDINKYRISHNQSPIIYNHQSDGINYIPEDIFFCHALEILNLPLPAISLANTFVMQEIYCSLPFAIHGFYYPFICQSHLLPILNSHFSFPLSYTL